VSRGARLGARGEIDVERAQRAVGAVDRAHARRAALLRLGLGLRRARDAFRSRALFDGTPGALGVGRLEPLAVRLALVRAGDEAAAGALCRRETLRRTPTLSAMSTAGIVPGIARRPAALARVFVDGALGDAGELSDFAHRHGAVFIEPAHARGEARRLWLRFGRRRARRLGRGARAINPLRSRAR
jgi:hypothetical protein